MGFAAIFKMTAFWILWVASQFDYFCVYLDVIMNNLVSLSSFSHFFYMPSTFFRGEFGGKLSDVPHLESIRFPSYTFGNNHTEFGACITIVSNFLYALHYFGRRVLRPSLKWPPSWISGSQSIQFILYTLGKHHIKVGACIIICTISLNAYHSYGRWVWRPSFKWPPSWIFEWPIDLVSFVQPWKSPCESWCLYHALRDVSLFPPLFWEMSLAAIFKMATILDFWVANRFSFFCTTLGITLPNLMLVSWFARCFCIPSTILGGGFGGHL